MIAIAIYDRHTGSGFASKMDKMIKQGTADFPSQRPNNSESVFMPWRLHDILPFRANPMQLATTSCIQPRNALRQLLHNSLLLSIRLRRLRHNKFSLKTHVSTVLPRQIQWECVFPGLQGTSQNYALSLQFIAFVVVADPLDPYFQVYLTGFVANKL